MAYRGNDSNWERDYCVYDSYGYDPNDSVGGPKSAIPIWIYLILIIVSATMGGALFVSVFGLLPLFVYYKLT